MVLNDSILEVGVVQAKRRVCVLSQFFRIAAALHCQHFEQTAFTGLQLDLDALLRDQRDQRDQPGVCSKAIKLLQLLQ